MIEIHVHPMFNSCMGRIHLIGVKEWTDLVHHPFRVINRWYPAAYKGGMACNA